jgi:thiol-disulfide isomerase/thioredoxin
MIRKTNIIILIIVLGASFILTLWSDNLRLPVWMPSWVPGQTEPAVAGRTAAPDVKMVDMNGETIELSDYRGKVIAINFWASWCAPCVVEFPDLIDLAEDKQDMLQMIFVSNDFKLENIDRFVSRLSDEHQDYLKNGANIDMILDKDMYITSKVFGTFNLPETYFIDTSGHTCKKIVGVLDFSAENIADIMSACQPQKKP